MLYEILTNIIGGLVGAVIGWLLVGLMYWKYEGTYKKALKENLYLIPVGFTVGAISGLIISFI
ncbi:hypothetical protein [Bacillus pretiosus]|uniref:hypothetical protein n=1 Tax=Bacillus pretiosus TaxID=2983392 RepID=UPI002EDA7126